MNNTPPCDLLFCLVTLFFTSCQCSGTRAKDVVLAQKISIDETAVATIPVPAGYKRLPEKKNSFACYLQQLPLKKDKLVYLYNGTLKANQDAQYAVLNVSVGNKNLQQCADAVIRLRTEHLFASGNNTLIRFQAGDGTWLRYTDWLNGKRHKLSGNKLTVFQATPVINSHDVLLDYLDLVFNYCGTATLSSSLQQKSLTAMQPGDVFLKPGTPGHAVIVMDMAENKEGKKIYLLAQSYMPAQDIHILKNPENGNNNPWYTLNDNSIIKTPEWQFYSHQLYGWR